MNFSLFLIFSPRIFSRFSQHPQVRYLTLRGLSVGSGTYSGINHHPAIFHVNYTLVNAQIRVSA
jgi:hypothetical protein